MFGALLDLLFPPQCAGCGAFGAGLCPACTPGSAPLVLRLPSLTVAATGAYEGALRRAILALKDGRRDVAESLAEALATRVETGATLVPVPTTAARRRVRGIDGVSFVAAAAARRAGASALDALDQRTGDAQRGRSRAQRLAARGRFRCDPLLEGVAVTLVDDVCTTGATLEDCARAVRAAGGRVERALVVAVAKPVAPWRPKAG